MGLLDDAEEIFFSRDLYQVLGVEKTCDEKKLKKAYYLLSMKFHPDKVQKEEDKENLTTKFQVLSRVYEILSNPEHRAVYDETGEIVDEGDVLAKDKDWDHYWRLLFKKISKQDIEMFEKEYKGSEDEKGDILKYYEEFEGDMDEIMANVMCSTYDDEPRIRSVIQTAIDNGEVEEKEAFTGELKSKKRKRRKLAKREEKEAEQHAKDLGIDSNTDLEALILKRSADRGKEFDSFLDNLEAKYAKKKPSKGSSTSKGKAKK